LKQAFPCDVPVSTRSAVTRKEAYFWLTSRWLTAQPTKNFSPLVCQELPFLQPNVCGKRKAEHRLCGSREAMPLTCALGDYKAVTMGDALDALIWWYAACVLISDDVTKFDSIKVGCISVTGE
jgi:hypothetical protein